MMTLPGTLNHHHGDKMVAPPASRPAWCEPAEDGAEEAWRPERSGAHLSRIRARHVPALRRVRPSSEPTPVHDQCEEWPSFDDSGDRPLFHGLLPELALRPRRSREIHLGDRASRGSATSGSAWTPEAAAARGPVEAWAEYPLGSEDSKDQG